MARRRRAVVYDKPLSPEADQLGRLGMAMCAAFRELDAYRRKLGLLTEQADRHLRA